jgi:hypothetical protein
LKIYRVKDWDEHYEIAQGRRYPTLKWVAIPNRHSSNGYSWLCQHKQAKELFCAFILIVEVASTMKKRGTLLSDGGKPLGPKELAFRTHFPQEIFELAFKELIKDEIQWLEVVER